MMKQSSGSDSPTRRGVTEALLSTVMLLAIVVGAPIVMHRVGGDPLKLSLGNTVRQISTHQLGGSDLIVHCLRQGTLILAWTAWIWLMICVAVEVGARVTGRTPVRLPASRSIQSMVALLVGTSLALSSMGRVNVTPKTDRARHASVAGVVGTDSRREHPNQRTTMSLRVIEDGPPDAPRPEPAWMKPDAESETATTGKRLRLPTTSTTRTLVEAPQFRPTGAEHLVTPRETLWSIARDRLGTPMRWRDIADLNYGVVQADGNALTSEHWIHPGWKLTLPSPTGQREKPTALGQVPLSVAFRSDELGVPPTGGALPIMPIGGSVMGAGVVSLLDRMRRVQQRYRKSATFIRLPDSAQRLYEQRLRIGEGHEMIDAVDLALRTVARTSIAMELRPPAVIGVRVQPETIELIVDRLDADLDISRYFDIRSDRCSVSIERSNLGLLEGEVRDHSAGIFPAPLLVSAGLGLEGLVLVNLESLGTLFVEGDLGGCDRIVRAFALELATSRWKDRFDLSLVGFGAEFERFGRVESVSELSPFLDRLHRRRLRGEVLLSESGHSSFAEGRVSDSSQRWDPVVIICAPTVDDQDVAELSELASDPRFGVSLIARAFPGEQHVLKLVGSEKGLSAELLSSIILLQQVSAEELSGVNALLDTASDRATALRSDEPYASISVPIPSDGFDTCSTSSSFHSPTATEATGSDGEVEFDIEVAVLGPIEIRGAAREFTRAWARELVVYLAMHPGGASNDAWATALWPDRLMAPSSLHSTASVARRALGQARNGLDHLPRSHGRLALADSVGTDWDKFVTHAESSDPGRWRSALGMVRGRLFEGLRSADWPTLEGIGPAIEAAVVDLSSRLAESCLSSEDADGAAWAARKGLLVSPYDERLYRILMRAADVGGNPAGVESVMSELIKLVADDIEPFDSVHPSTMELYRSLSRRRKAIR